MILIFSNLTANDYQYPNDGIAIIGAYVRNRTLPKFFNRAGRHPASVIQTHAGCSTKFIGLMKGL